MFVYIHIYIFNYTGPAQKADGFFYDSIILRSRASETDQDSSLDSDPTVSISPSDYPSIKKIIKKILKSKQPYDKIWVKAKERERERDIKYLSRIFLCV